MGLGQLWEPGCELDQDENSGELRPARDLLPGPPRIRHLPYGKSACPGRPTRMYACVSALYVSSCMCVCLCRCGVSFLLGLVSPPPLPVQALTHPRPRCQPPAPAVCCGRCLAVPWQRQNRMYLWILPGCPCRFPPQRLAGKNCWGPGRGQMVFVWERGRASVLLGVSGSGRRGCTCTSQLSPSWSSELVCSPLPVRAMLRKQGRKRSCSMSSPATAH